MCCYFVESFIIYSSFCFFWVELLVFCREGASLVVQMVKNLPAVQETQAQFLGWERSPGEGHGNPLQCSCLENPMDREAWQATVYRVTKNWT